jgi:23S rRNA (cytidine1920-2'-O)/16S rRNA (cytidine1409-2'-O)-methyltransferase
MEQTNLRHLQPEDLPCAVDFATLDLSFISVLKVLPAVCGVLRPGGQLVVLVKPQFEAGRDKVGAGGVVRDAAVRKEVVERVVAGVEAHGLSCVGVMESPLKGEKSGNTEFLAYFRHEEGAGPLLVALSD